MKPLEAGACHFMVDIWTSRSKEAVLGIKAQFIDEHWKLMNVLLGFKHFSDHHTATNIRKLFSNITGQFVQPHQVTETNRTRAIFKRRDLNKS